MQYAINQQGTLLARGLYDISYAISQPRFTETRTNGRSWGGAQTTTHEVYEEHTISEGEAFTTGENWSTAWAVDSSHAADLTFNYTVKNTGTEYARELTGFVFNIYLGDDTTPIISYPAWQQFPDGKLENVFPGAVNTFASTSIPLTLEQMKRIDLGDRLTVVLEDYSFGADELFYQDAVNGGVTVFVEDGVDDGDELVDSYVIPTWQPESVQDILTRYFPAGYDLDGNLNSLWTPEFDGINPPTWNEHYLSDIAWWNIYLTQADAGNTPLKDLAAQAGSAILFRFNRDSDRDGYSDRVEMHYSTDKNDPVSHPQPEVLAGYVASRSGNVVTVKLVLENSGTFDAYGIDAVMYAPDGTTTIGNNTVGGNGRVRPGAHVAVGSLVKPPSLTDWGGSTAQPYSGGNYTGSTDRAYTFSATTPGVVGQGGTAMGWNDGAGSSGTLDLGDSYHAPLPLGVAEGLQIGFNTGIIMAGSTFTVAALTPRDTFTYTINSEPYTPPVIVVSYSDPQGSHRFVTPVELSSLDDELAPYTGQMLEGLALEVAATDPVTASGSNATNFVFNSPHPSAIENAHLYLNFVSDGELVAEMPFTFTLQPGPTVYPAVWSTSAFSQTYSPDADNILIAFWTDAQDNIIDSAARPLDTFAADPGSAFAISTADTTWDFGAVPQGTLLNHSLTFANTGFLDMLAYVSAPAGITLSQQGSRSVWPADTTSYEITLDTAELPVGPYDQTVTIRTSDPDNPVRTVHVMGTIAALADQALPDGIPYRPWDELVYVPGPHNVNDVITYTHTIVPDAPRVHPLYVYNQDRSQLLGVGEYGPDFTGQTAPFGVLGDGSDGDITVTTVQYTDDIRTAMNSTSNAGQKVLNVASVAGFAVGHEVLVIQMQGTGVGNYEFGTVAGIGSGTLTLRKNLANTYTVGGNSKVQVIRVPHYRTMTIQNGGTLTAHPWDYNTGGVLVFRAQMSLIVETGGTITMSGMGYVGQPANWNDNTGIQGEGIGGPGYNSYLRNYTGGGGGESGGNGNVGGGGGGGHGTDGEVGGHGSGGTPDLHGGEGGNTVGNLELQTWHMGGAGGSGGDKTDAGHYGGAAGSGGGVIAAFARTMQISGTIVSNGTAGSQGSCNCGTGGAGAGGMIYLAGQSVTIGGVVSAIGGPHVIGNCADGWGGFGGVGRIRIDYQSLLGTTNPAAYTNQVVFYIIKQSPSDSNGVEYTLPASITTYSRYWLQYGEHITTAAMTPSGMATVRLPKRPYDSATLDVLLLQAGVTTPSTPTLTLDVGDNGSVEWTTTRTFTQPMMFGSPDFGSALSAYVMSATPDPQGYVNVPLRVTLGITGDLFLTNLAVVPGPAADAAPGASVTFSPADPVETDIVTVTATLSNTANLDTDDITVAFYATSNQLPASSNQQYIGSALLPNISAGGTAQAVIQWNTLGFTGTVPVRVVADPFNRLGETDEDNNVANITLTIRTRPDVHINAITLSDDEPMAGETVTITLPTRNAGQTAAGSQTIALYRGIPDAGGVPMGTQVLASLPGETGTVITFTWTPTMPGPYRLFARADRDGQVDEFDEGNNDTWRDVYVGLPGSVLLDSGTPGEQVYTTTVGYGVLDEGQPDVFSTCAGGTLPEHTLRRDPDGQVIYRFDHLLPGHFYHLDVTLYECDMAGRQESIYVDDNLIAGPEDLGDGEVHRLSLRLDPALYVDRAARVVIKTPDVDGAVVSQVNLHDVDYRYTDAGGSNDLPYSQARGYGWLDGVLNTSWGTMPRQSVRVDQDDNELRYRFDRLDPAKRYRLHFTFWQLSGTTHIQRVRVDGVDAGITVNTGDYQPHVETARVPLAGYVSDGSIVVSIVRLNASAGAMVSEIALEEETSLPETVCTTLATPSFSEVYGSVLVNGQPAPAGTLVYALSPRGDMVGCFVVESDGQYGLMRIYGEDAQATPPIPGMRAGEWVAFRVDGAPAVATPSFYWSNDKIPHQVDLAAGGIEGQFILLRPLWNLVSFRLEPPDPPVVQVLDSVNGRYDRVLGENGIYVPTLPPAFNSLKELHAGKGYYVRLSGETSANSLVEGLEKPATTPIPLHPGWNWIGYYPMVPISVTVALQSIDGHYQRVLSLDKTFDPALPGFSTLKALRPGEGYLLYVDDAVTLVYPAGLMAGELVPETQPAQSSSVCQAVNPTPRLTIVYGQVTVNGNPAPVGTRVEVVTPQGKVAGCIEVQTPGQFGLMHVYGVDDGDVPQVLGFNEGEPLAFRVNGVPALASWISPVEWQDDKTPHFAELQATIYPVYLPLIVRQ